MLTPHEWQALLRGRPEAAEGLALLAKDMIEEYPQRFVRPDPDPLSPLEVSRPEDGRLTRGEAEDFISRLEAAESTEDRIKLAVAALSVLKLTGGVV